MVNSHSVGFYYDCDDDDGGKQEETEEGEDDNHSTDISKDIIWPAGAEPEPQIGLRAPPSPIAELQSSLWSYRILERPGRGVRGHGHTDGGSSSHIYLRFFPVPTRSTSVPTPFPHWSVLSHFLTKSG